MPPARRSARTVSSIAARESAQPYTRANTRSSPGSQRPSASIAANGKTSLRLTVKAPPSKLRQATSGSSIPPNPYADNPSESDTTPAPRVARSTRNPRTVVDPDSDEVDEDAEGEEEDEDVDEDMDQESLNHEDSEEDAEGEDEDEDELQQDHPPPPVIKQDRPNGKAKPNVTVTAPPEGPLKSVEAKEMEDDDDDDEDELSELPDEEDVEELSELSSDSDDENSRSATPDLTKLTKRQRGAYDEAPETSLMALSNEAQKKKHLTAEEHAMRRAEMARRRKNLSEKRNEEEKVCRRVFSRLCSTDSEPRWTQSINCSVSQRQNVERGRRWKRQELPNSRLVRRMRKTSLILCICDGSAMRLVAGLE